MSPVPAEEPPSERSVSGQSGRPSAIGHRPSTQSITPHLSRLSRQATALVSAAVSRYRPASPCPLKPSG
jgi:hypothetical protein